MTFRIDQHFGAVAFEHHIFRLRFVGVFKFVRQAGAARSLNAETNANTFAALGNVLIDMVGGGLGERDWHYLLRKMGN